VDQGPGHLLSSPDTNIITITNTITIIIITIDIYLLP
jgi:hypothetical protein